MLIITSIIVLNRVLNNTYFSENTLYAESFDYICTIIIFIIYGI